MKRNESPGGVRFITFSCHRGLPLFSNPAICLVFAEVLAAARVRLRLRLCAWVIMPEHVHLLAIPASGVHLGDTLRSIKMSVARRVLARWRKLNAPILLRLAVRESAPRFWQAGGGFDRNVRDDAELSRSIRYIHRNPVRRGLTARPEDWPWSSVRWWMGERGGLCDCEYPPGNWDRWTGFA